MKKILLPALAVVLVITGAWFLFAKNKSNGGVDQQALLQETYVVSVEYLNLRYQTEKVLEKAKDFGSYDSWNREMDFVIKGWEDFEKKVLKLETKASKLSQENIEFSITSSVYAYSKQEINSIIDSAPFGKKITTLAKHLGVDAKHAQLILNQTQDQISREAYGEEGDVFEECEQNSMRIKNGCKVAGFVGATVLTGGATGVLATTATVVTGADLVLEITDDEARIALGDKNKVSEMVSNIRNVTEPAASILTISNIPGNLSKGIDKLSALSFGADQLRSVIQDEKVLGISIKANEQGELKTEASALTQEELNQWRQENNAPKSSEPVEEIIKNAQNIVKNLVVEEIEDKKNSQGEKEENTTEVENKKEIGISGENIPNQIYKIVNVSGTSYMMDVCLSPTCWDDLNANPAEDRDLGGIYTLGKVYGHGESFKSGFRPAEVKASGKLVETSANSYKITVYFAIAPFEGPKHKTINYGTWQNHSVEIKANYGDEPVIEWDGSALKQVR